MKTLRKMLPDSRGRKRIRQSIARSCACGAAGVMQHIIKLEPIRVVYVSCNPATLARDSDALLNAGYAIRRLAMLDMFPHTGHGINGPV